MTTREKPKRARDVLEKLTGPYTFAMFMRGARTTLDLTQEEMAKRLKISKQALCEIEKGRTLVAPETAAKYASLAGLSEQVAVEACLQDQLRKADLNYEIQLKAL